MILIREYNETSDSQAVGILIADTFREYNLDFVSEQEQALFLGPFQHALSSEPAHQEAIERVIQASMVFVADEDGEIIGVLRGRADRLQSLFVSGAHHRRGIGRQLVEHFERECVQQGAKRVKVAAALYALPFYLAIGYKRSTGVRQGHSFEGQGLPVQPMRKVFG